jgi:uncharacterized protein (DUF433 family)
MSHGLPRPAEDQGMSVPILSNLPPFLNYADGEVRLTGHRIGLFHVVRLLEDGYTPEQIHEEYDWPPEKLGLIQQVIEFYQAHRAEVDAYVAEYQADLDRQYAAYVPGPGILKMRQLLAERAAARAEAGSDDTDDPPGVRVQRILDDLRRAEGR